MTIGTRTKVTILLLAELIYSTCSVHYANADHTIQLDKNSENPQVLTAFFGLDNSLPFRAGRISLDAPGQDGLPIVFSHEIDEATLDAEDFRIKTNKGNFLYPSIVTLRPANEPLEHRTVLLIGELGTYPADEPSEIKIVGDLRSIEGQSYTGQLVSVTPLADGPFLSYAEYFTFDHNYPYVASGPGADCPLSRTELIVRTVWAGGIRAIDGRELSERELTQFKVTLLLDNGKEIVANPFMLADLNNDNDNNVDLCLEQSGVPLQVQVESGIAIDPRGDVNPSTHITPVRRD